MSVAAISSAALLAIPRDFPDPVNDSSAPTLVALPPAF
jgi:hypothetical protein